MNGDIDNVARREIADLGQMIEGLVELNKLQAQRIDRLVAEHGDLSQELGELRALVLAQGGITVR